jgi:hypothetical protein
MALAFFVLASCSPSPPAGNGEILLALKPEAAARLLNPDEPDPNNTGLASLDSLNRKWEVKQMVRLFPDISPDDEVAVRQGLTGMFKLIVPAKKDLAAMLKDYQADPNVEYAESNQAFEIK